MKKYLITLLLGLITQTIIAQNGYIVNGDLKGLSDGKIQIRKSYDGEILNETTVKDGKFVFKHTGEFLGDKVYLAGSDFKKRMTFYLEPGNIKIQGSTTNIVASGTVSNDAYNKYLEAVTPIENQITELRKKARTEKDSSVLKEIETKLNYQYSELFYPLRKKIAHEHNNTILAAEFLSAGTGQLTYTDMKELISTLDPNTAENWYTNRLKNRLEILSRTDIGQVLPDFTLPDTSGNPFTFSSLRGEVVLVDFWASWCAPCREENKNVLELYKRYNKDGFNVISVSIDDDRKRWTDAIIQDKLVWHHASSLTGWSCPVANSLGVALGMSGVPYTLLVGRDGRVIGHNIRGNKLAQKLKEIFEHNQNKSE